MFRQIQAGKGGVAVVRVYRKCRSMAHHRHLQDWGLVWVVRVLPLQFLHGRADGQPSLVAAE